MKALHIFCLFCCISLTMCLTRRIRDVDGEETDSQITQEIENKENENNENENNENENNENNNENEETVTNENIDLQITQENDNNENENNENEETVTKESIDSNDPKDSSVENDLQISRENEKKEIDETTSKEIIDLNDPKDSLPEDDLQITQENENKDNEETVTQEAIVLIDQKDSLPENDLQINHENENTNLEETVTKEIIDLLDTKDSLLTETDLQITQKIENEEPEETVTKENIDSNDVSLPEGNLQNDDIISTAAPEAEVIMANIADVATEKSLEDLSTAEESIATEVNLLSEKDSIIGSDQNGVTETTILLNDETTKLSALIIDEKIIEETENQVTEPQLEKLEEATIENDFIETEEMTQEPTIDTTMEPDTTIKTNIETSESSDPILSSEFAILSFQNKSSINETEDEVTSEPTTKILISYEMTPLFNDTTAFDNHTLDHTDVTTKTTLSSTAEHTVEITTKKEKKTNKIVVRIPKKHGITKEKFMAALLAVLKRRKEKAQTTNEVNTDKAEESVLTETPQSNVDEKQENTAKAEENVVQETPPSNEFEVTSPNNVEEKEEKEENHVIDGEAEDPEPKRKKRNAVEVDNGVAKDAVPVDADDGDAVAANDAVDKDAAADDSISADDDYDSFAIDDEELEDLSEENLLDILEQNKEDIASELGIPVEDMQFSKETPSQVIEPTKLTTLNLRTPLHKGLMVVGICLLLTVIIVAVVCYVCMRLRKVKMTYNKDPCSLEDGGVRPLRMQASSPISDDEMTRDEYPYSYTSTPKSPSYNSSPYTQVHESGWVVPVPEKSNGTPSTPRIQNTRF